MCVLPAVLEAVQEPVFDFGGDVAVGFDEPVGQVVAKAAGLGDFRDTVGDQAGLVAVPQSMKCQPASHWLGPFVWVAVDGGSEHAAVEVAASQAASPSDW